MTVLEQNRHAQGKIPKLEIQILCDNSCISTSLVLESPPPPRCGNHLRRCNVP